MYRNKLKRERKIAMNNSIYVVWDLIAQAMAGPIFTHRHDAPAVREFTEVLGNPQTTLGKNPSDYNLLRLGEINENAQLTPGLVTTVLTGKEWLETQQKQRGA